MGSLNNQQRFGVKINIGYSNNKFSCCWKTSHLTKRLAGSELDQAGN